jgi:FkbM family methyltransferase
MTAIDAHSEPPLTRSLKRPESERDDQRHGSQRCSSIKALDKLFRLLLNDHMLSYAQNMEDMVLARVFAGQTNGFYIDIGGGHAVADNVSFLAYEQGWSGLVVEPQAKLAALYAKVRPRDMVVHALCGREEGELTLFEATTFHGLSTASASHASAAEAAGVAGSRVTKPVTTLAAICAAHAPTVIDFLKIDVEGHEPDVIAGNDWSRFRPRVVLVEAIEPLTMADASERFEPALLAAGYRFAFFDNLNRWYVAEEAVSVLLPLFPQAPLPWDSVTHLGEFGPADEDARHPDHSLAKRLPRTRFSDLPFLSADELARYGARNADPVALARISALFDGGYIV